MTDPTTHPAGAGTPEPAPATQPVNGVAVADRRTLRHITRAEQERLSADADVERRARAARLALELREQRRAAARQEREAAAADRQARAEARRARRGARRAKVRAAAPVWAERALFVLPILFPMAVAWVGQIRFAMTVMGWPLAAAVVFAAGFELSTAYVARLDWLSRAAGDSALLFRSATWAFAAGAATMNYWHAAGPGLAPNGEAVSYGLMSITGVVLWELLSTYRHRTALRADGKLPAARPRFGLARWIWFRPLTRVAWLLALRDGYPTTEMAWRAAIGAVEVYGSPKHARNAVRSGRPVPRPEPLDNHRDDGCDDGCDDGWDDDAETTEHRDNGHDGHSRDIETRPEDRVNAERDCPVRDEQRDTERDNVARDNVARDTIGQAASCPVSPSETPTSRDDVGDREAVPTLVPPPVDDRGRVDRTHDVRNGGPREQVPDGRADVDDRRHLGDGAMRAQMEAFARASLAAGDRITGADLDRRFGTRDYGRRVLREILAATSRDPAGHLAKVAAPGNAG